MISWRSTWSIYTRELMRFLRTAFQSVLAPVLTTSLYFIVFGAAIGGRMPDLGGLSVLRHMVEQGLEIPVVMLTTSADEGDLSESLRNGARGYLLKDMEPDELVLALQEIVSGKIVVAPALTSVLADLVRHGERRERKDDLAPFSSLTPREHEILCHLSEGQSNKVIARHLDISDGTVKLHVKAILRKLGVHSRVEAAVMAVEKGVCNRSSRE